MAYVTVSDLSARLGTSMYGRLTDREDGETPQADVAQQVIDEAEAEANSYLAQRYATPVDLSAHPELADLLAARVLDLAEWNAWKSSPFANDPPARVQRVYEVALRWLQDVAAGRIPLPASAPPTSRTAVDGSPRYVVTPRAFTADELDGL